MSEATIARLTAAAMIAATRAYAPYSNFAVGAALLFDDGAILSGANVENASYGLSCCAERNALFGAISQRGPAFRILAAAVFHRGPDPCPPCGACLQVLSEFVTNSTMIYFSQGPSFLAAPFNDLLPIRFDKASL